MLEVPLFLFYIGRYHLNIAVNIPNNNYYHIPLVELARLLMLKRNYRWPLLHSFLI